MTQPGSYDVARANRDRDRELQRLRVQAALAWPREARALEAAGLAEGQQVVELGSGPGFYTAQLLEKFPRVHVTAVERDATLIEDAKRNLAGRGLERVTFVHGSADETGLPSDAFDFAFARLLFQHLPDPGATAREAYRCLAPGGAFSVIDVDDDMLVLFDPPLPGLAELESKMAAVQAKLGGNRRIGRRLWRILAAEGFTGLSLEMAAAHSDEAGIDPFRRQFDTGMLSGLVRAGLMSSEELDRLTEQANAYYANPDVFVLMSFFIVSGKKTAR
jgi:ubiquinone/menaquinone biosynthesis C-methylase UbiE